jgi:E3 ubiquitin-protein ligase UBR1
MFDRLYHNVSFFIAQQSGGCCDCGDEEAWRRPIQWETSYSMSTSSTSKTHKTGLSPLHSPDEPSVPVNEADLRLQPSADPIIREMIAAELLSPRKRDSFTKHLTPAMALNLDGEI